MLIFPVEEYKGSVKTDIWHQGGKTFFFAKDLFSIQCKWLYKKNFKQSYIMLGHNILFASFAFKNSFIFLKYSFSS